MGNLVVAGALFGMILGRFFKWPVLIPAYGLVSVMVVANPAHMENSLAGWCVQTVMLINKSPAKGRRKNHAKTHERSAEVRFDFRTDGGPHDDGP